MEALWLIFNIAFIFLVFSSCIPIQRPRNKHIYEHHKIAKTTNLMVDLWAIQCYRFCTGNNSDETDEVSLVI